MFLFNRIALKSLNCYARLYSLGKKCHYDVLRLRRNCTDKEIKEAFIKMSKEYHPDKNKDAKAQERFVSIVEAYNVLGKPSSRAQYDILSRSNSAYVQRTHVPWNLRNNPAYQYQYQNTQTNTTQQPRKEKSYYGVSGVKKMPNYMIIMICCGFALVGLVVQMYVIRHSFLLHRENINEKSRIAAEELDKVRAAAEENGNESEPVLRENVQENVSASIPGYTNHPLGDLGGLFGDLFFLPESMEAIQVESESKNSFSVLAEVLQPEDEVELQTRLLLEKIVNGANPTVATASLGQELATEKKESPADRVLTEYGLSEDAGGDWYTSSFRSNIKKNPLGLAFEIETWFE
ncbi:dnaJ-like protein 60 isoform X1 [Cydia pomonella]|uniref:dnaJ-like protein 60 isoform X1 n=1 Tax=Cydia pomonella TaxID=82600 RepID=UPI002ADE0E29|nr:dnaJ-like protein 60 isoform X1 [Cydia pomonella]